MLLDEAPYHGEANSAASFLAASVAVHPVVGLENAFALGRRNSLALVFAYQAPRPIVRLRGHFHRLSIGPIAHRIVEKIEKHLSHGGPVDVRDQSALEIGLEAYVAIAGEGLESSHDLVDLGRNIR